MRQGDQTDQLFTALAEQLKVPLLQIARLSELSQEATLPRIAVISDHALRLVDAYVQSRAQNQVALLLEPITTSAVLYDVATDLLPFARQNDYTIEIDLSGKGVPIMAHHQSLRTMLSLLGASLIEVGAEDDTIPRHLVLGTHRSSRGTIVGAFSSHLELSQRALQLTRSLHGRATQVVPALGLAGGAGLAIADRLSEQMSAPLRAYRHRSLTGIGSLLVPSHQLQMI
ncbi:MAG TPA: hypothetical protein VLE74_02315 [Candidatus Saccharimonadales bacterium]|nr:hypothetical protein [Candidatus Saccharimonadales bacterium]